ncbi:MAG: cyclic nucleotide-binding domain-containing protein [Candidatus Omnitrophica bacterium]|nr:cyclic nucleotide-binding domain-containing protein [Candidatus Omnitrophota bacterium]
MVLHKSRFFLFKVLKEVKCDKEEIIFNQGESATYIYIIKSGRVKLYVGVDHTPLELIEFDVGQCFGESSLIGIQPHTANAIVVEKTELIVLSGSALLILYNEYIDIYTMILLNIAREISRRLSKVDDILLHYVLKK